MPSIADNSGNMTILAPSHHQLLIQLVEEHSGRLRDAVEALGKGKELPRERFVYLCPYLASKLPAKQRSANISSIVDVVCSHALNHGLDADVLRAVVQIATKRTELDQTSVTTLVKNLYPSQRVPADVVVTVVGSLGQGKGKPSTSTQNGLVRWLAIVYGVVEDPKLLSRLYGVLFGMLDMISIRCAALNSVCPLG